VTKVPVMSRVPSEMKERLQRMARENHRTLSQEILRALTLYLQRPENAS